jgi:WD40 repeat protein
VTSVAFSPDGQILVNGSRDKSIKLWNLATGKEIRTLKEASDKAFPLAGVNSIAISPTGQTLASGSVDNTIKIWRVLR